jgi:hypothetical protein
LFQEINNNYRSEYRQRLEKIPVSQRVYVDETGFDAPLIRHYGYAKRVQRLYGEQTGKRFARTSLIGGLHNGKALAPMEFKGYCNTEVVMTWVKGMSIPCLRKGDVVIWDNATFHKSPRIAEALEDAGIGLLFLPA